MMRDTVSALLQQAPDLERASQMQGRRLPVPSAFEGLLPDAGLRPGTATQVCGIGAATLALSLVSRISQEAWAVAVGLPSLGLRAAAEIGVDLDHLVVVDDPGERWTDVLAALIDAFDVVIARPQLHGREARRVAGRIRERDAVFVTVGAWADSDVRIEGTAARWHGIGHGHGHLAARTVDVAVSGRRSAARTKRATLWLPDRAGEVALAEPSNVVRLAR